MPTRTHWSKAPQQNSPCLSACQSNPVIGWSAQRSNTAHLSPHNNAPADCTFAMHLALQILQVLRALAGGSLQYQLD